MGFGGVRVVVVVSRGRVKRGVALCSPTKTEPCVSDFANDAQGRGLQFDGGRPVWSGVWWSRSGGGGG